ncbi:DUF3102 domain-containing protein [Propionivibrio sp.]|uniref:DUF3102 domain-containing protein n=1 Tax=Propionivibrio sp. TaxID=2212460 RepID=UPI003BF3BD0B
MTATTHTAIAATGAASTDLMTTASQINHHHKLACIKAGEAVGHAVEAGKLLLSVKASLQHGDFGAWLTNNLNVTDRTARRYMAAALGKPLPVRAIKNDKLPPMIEAVKTDTVSVLEDAKTSPNQQALQQEHDAKRATVAWKAGERAYEKLNDAVSESQKIENQTKADISIRFKYMLSKKLYVHGGYKTFEEYCLDQFGWSPEEVEEIHTDAFLYNLSKGKGAAA